MKGYWEWLEASRKYKPFAGECGSKKTANLKNRKLSNYVSGKKKVKKKPKNHKYPLKPACSTKQSIEKFPNGILGIFTILTVVTNQANRETLRKLIRLEHR